MFCSKCGAELKEQSAFCSACGARVAQAQPVNPAYQQPQQWQQPLQPVRQKKPGGKKLWLWLVLGGVVLAAIAAGAILLRGGAAKQRDPHWVAARTTEYKADGSVSSWSEFEYDANRNCTGYNRYEGTGEFESRTEYAYDEAGNRVQETYYDSDGSVSGRMELSYDANGNMVKQLGLEPDGTQKWVREYEYDAHGYLVKESYHSYNYALDVYIAFTYVYTNDSNGNMLTRTKYDSNGVRGEWIEYTNNAQGSVVKEIGYDRDGVESWINEYEYASNGNRTKSSYYLVKGGQPELDTRYIQEYDLNGNCIKSTNYDSDGSVSYWSVIEWIYIP